MNKDIVNVLITTKWKCKNNMKTDENQKNEH